VEHAKGTIEDTVATVKRTFGLPFQVEQHPWPMMGGALLAGLVPPPHRASSARPQPQQGLVSGILDQLKDEMQDEIASFQRVAVRAVMSTLREVFKQAISTLAPHTASAVTTSGGQAGESPAQHPASMSCAALNGAPS
jgi:hypothetical protein